MRATDFETGLPDWLAAKGDIRYFGQVELTVNRMRLYKRLMYCWIQVRTLLILVGKAALHRHNLLCALSVPTALPSHPPSATVPLPGRLSKGIL